MKATPLSRLALALLFALALASPNSSAKIRSRPSAPNIILIVADDLGWGDVGWHGSKIRTPNLDRLAQEGVRLERFYSAARCSPTRYGLMTGELPIREGLMAGVIFPWHDTGIPAGKRTLPEALGATGYGERALVGKWHLGASRRAYHPMAQGFTSFYGIYGGAVDYFTRRTSGGGLDWTRDYQPVEEPGYTTELLSDEAVRIIERGGAARPYFLTLAYTAPHWPLQAPDRDIADYSDVFAEEDRRKLAAMITLMDRGIGRVLAALERSGQANNTLVLFISDNGGELPSGGVNLPLRGAKGTGFEGGIRVPALMRWPDGGFVGGRSVEALFTYLDVKPTLLEIAGARADRGDGESRLNALRANAAADNAERVLFSHSGWGENEWTAVTRFPWKLVRRGVDFARPDAPEPSFLALFNIEADPNETTDLSPSNPAIALELLHEMRRYRMMRPAQGGVTPPLPVDRTKAGPSGIRVPNDYVEPPIHRIGDR